MAYKTTSVSVERSREAIRKLLIGFGVRGVQFSEDFQDHLVNVKFAKMIDGNMRTVSVSLKIPEPPKPKRRHTYYSAKSNDDRWMQMERATYRALHWWLKSQFEAVEFGLLSFEDVFLSHFEWMIDGHVTTVGKIIRPHLSSGEYFLPEPSNDDPVEARYEVVNHG